MRLFVGVDVPAVSVEEIRLGRPEAPAHLTVLFLGEVAPERATGIAEAFADAVRDHVPFDLELKGVGVFPDPARSRVVWIGVGDGSQELGRLHDALVAACRALALPIDTRPLVPHLTLRRVHGRRDVERAQRWLLEFPATSFGRGRVTELLLKESLLGAGPAVHRTVARLPLTGRAPTG